MSGLANLPDYLVQIGFSLLPGVTRVAVLGHNPSIDTTTTPEDIWDGGGLYPWMSIATSLELVSSSASDTSAGTGARTVLVSGLDTNYVAVSETVTLNGTTAVALASQYLRINQMLVLTSGSNGTNVGTLTLRDSGAGTTRALIGLIGTLGTGITRQAIYTVPAGFTLQIISQYLGINGSGSSRTVDIVTSFKTTSGNTRTPLVLTCSDGRPYRHDGIPGITINEKTDITMRCVAVSNNASELSAAFLALLRKN